MVSAYDTLKDAIKEYNKTGVLSVETFQALMALSPQFLQMFFNQATAAQTAESAIYAQAEALKVAKIQELQAAAASDILALAEGRLSDMSPVASSAIASLGNNATVAGNKAGAAASPVNALASAVQNLINASQGKLGAGVNVSSFIKQATAIKNAYVGIAKSISSISVSGVSSGGGGGGGGGSKTDDQAKAIAEAYDDLLSYTMKMLKKEQEDRIDLLEEELDVQEELYKAEKERIENEIKGYKEIIDKKKESLKEDKRAKDYADEIDEANKEISDLQKSLADLLFDTTEGAKAQRLKLEEELAKKQKDLANKQYDHEIDLAEDALDSEFDLYEEQKDNELSILENAFEATKTDYENRIDLLKKYLEEENTIRVEALALIEGRTKEYYDRLFEWNTKYGDIVNASLQETINKSQETAAPAASSKKYKTTYKIIADDGSGKVLNSGYGVGSSSSSSKSSAKTLAMKKMTSVPSYIEYGKTASYHKGLEAGFVGNLKGNEAFIKALRGEAYITPKQQNNYMNKILPEMLSSARSLGSMNFEKLIEINVSGSIDSNSVTKVQNTITAGFEKLNKVFNGNGIIRKANGFT
jgi:hypothetical protein